jgi:Uma2 family endonuclease
MIRTAPGEPTAEQLQAALSHPDASYEVVDGQIVESPEMSLFAHVVAQRLAEAMAKRASELRAGFVLTETLFILDASRDLRRRPDVAFVSFDRWPMDREIPVEGDCEVVPDIAVEVLSPNDLARDVSRKLGEYFRSGVRHVWVVQPSEGEISIYDSPKRATILSLEDTLDGSGILTGLQSSLSGLFRRTLG